MLNPLTELNGRTILNIYNFSAKKKKRKKEKEEESKTGIHGRKRFTWAGMKCYLPILGLGCQEYNSFLTDWWRERGSVKKTLGLYKGHAHYETFELTRLVFPQKNVLSITG